MAYTLHWKRRHLSWNSKTHRSRNGKDEFDPAEIRDDEWLFGEQSRIQLDSLDAFTSCCSTTGSFWYTFTG